MVLNVFKFGELIFKKIIMEYKVIPFVASIDSKTGNSNQVAKQLESIIENYTSQGWEYIRLESVSTFVQPDQGCFGIAAKPGYSTSNQMIVFRKI